ncbi:50S ribosomal protein L11 methyltransferase [Eupransor demetentiae]|uniref:Ribosomal protein L11 methyltransferase n=1 Tax=Eupransor demetentiae TaxID=3109584 RepID=A0ABM9N3T0_9LACO|nr:Ribosomal protein L11 methylase PrmA (PrmA) [Lactobacillaceae bacterium LMG 33000]
MTWRSLAYLVNDSAVDLVNTTIVEAGLSGSEILPAENGQSWVKVYLDKDDDYEDKKAALRAALEDLSSRANDLGPLTVQEADLDQSDWDSNWKQYYHAERITQQFTVVPAWEDYQKEQASEKLIVMDPELAFGTGTHPTTRLMLQAIETVVRGGESVIDVGTGSGVLAFAAKLLGAEKILATDIDQEAVEVAQKNLALNPGGEDIEVVASDLLKDVDWPPVDLILANILADVITPLVPQAYQQLKVGGKFLVSGIYDNVAEEIRQALTAAGFTILQSAQMGEWHAYIAEKSQD